MKVNQHNNYINFALQSLEQINTEKTKDILLDYSRDKPWNYYALLLKQYETKLHDCIGDEYKDVDKYYRLHEHSNDFLVKFIEIKIIVLAMQIIDMCHYYAYSNKMPEDEKNL